MGLGELGGGWSSGEGEEEGWREERRVGSEQTGTLCVIRVLLGRSAEAEEEDEEGMEEVIEADLDRGEVTVEVDAEARSEDTSDSLVQVVQSLGKIKLQNK